MQKVKLNFEIFIFLIPTKATCFWKLGGEAIYPGML
jgi:hypothetical protein